MAKLPIDLSGREVRAALEWAGFVFRRQSGSHIRRTPCQGRLPDHKQVRTGTLRRIIADAGTPSLDQNRLVGNSSAR